VLGAALWIAATALQDWFTAPSMLQRAGGLAALVGAGLAVYAVAIVASGAVSIRQLGTLLRRPAPPA